MSAPPTAPTDFADRFENLEVDARTFGHREHLQAAHAMLCRYPFLVATARYAETVSAMAAREGDTEKFNVTITLAFMALLAECMEAEPHREFDELVEAHPELLSSNVLERFYSPERLWSPTARRVFVMPDAVPQLANPRAPLARPSR